VRFFQESCSVNVNIVVALHKCFESQLRAIFRERIFSTSNTFIMLLNSSLTCTILQESGNVYDGFPSQFDLISIYLLKNGEAEYANNFCYFCSSKHKQRLLPSTTDLHSIHELRSFSAQVRKESHLPIIGVIIDDAGVESQPKLVRRCGFLYRVRKYTKLNIIACKLDLITMENIAFALNLSLELIQYDQILHYRLVTFRTKHYFTVAVLQIFGL